jgi:hypothetical protein
MNCAAQLQNNLLPSDTLASNILFVASATLIWDFQPNFFKSSQAASEESILPRFSYDPKVFLSYLIR